MSILRVACGPADIGVGGYAWHTSNTARFDPNRVEGCFATGDELVLTIPHDAPSGQEVWYHFRHAQADNSYVLIDGTFITIEDANSEDLVRIGYADAKMYMEAVGDTTDRTGSQQLGQDVPYSIDLHVIVGSTVTCRWYINGALYGEKTVDNVTGGRGVPRSITWASGNPYQTNYCSEVVIADEDTRGMRVREMRPKSFGIYQEWDGSISALRDDDLATGISTDTANRRVSFGVTNIENIQPGDVINRVVAQTYAQKGETGLSAFNHFFRHKNGNVSDGVDHTLSVLGDYFVEEFPNNPDTGVSWQPEDFGSLQTGLQSKT
ncbi:hypothetical protein MAL1_00025 [Bacteriophage DSS3_MAL1]|nr:hypothetical protein MAL1_00025 [Bacteriophage DSS3_MAL1]